MTTVPANAIAADDPRPAGSWIAADWQSELDMRGATLGEALGELLEECGSDEERASILAGSIELADL